MTTLNQNRSKMNGSLTTEPDCFSDEAWSLLLKNKSEVEGLPERALETLALAA